MAFRAKRGCGSVAWALLLLGCGARSGLSVPEPSVDAGQPDAEVDARTPPMVQQCIDATETEWVDLSFKARIESADVLLLIDVTGSMGEELAQIRATLRDRIVPEIERRIPDVQLAVASFADFPVGEYGGGPDYPFRLDVASTANVWEVQHGLDGLVEVLGADAPESQVEALYQVATGEGRGEYVPPADCPRGTVGYPCFRELGSRIVMLFTDAQFHNSPRGTEVYDGDLFSTSPATYDEAARALQAIGARVLPLFSGRDFVSSAWARRDLRRVAGDTGAVTAGGDPIMVSIGEEAEGLDEGVVETVRTLVDETPMSLDAVAEDWPGDEVDATRLVERIEPWRADPPGWATKTDRGFEDVQPGTRVTFRLRLDHGALTSADPEQRYLLRIVLRRGGVVRMKEKLIEIVVPGRTAGCGGRM